MAQTQPMETKSNTKIPSTSISTLSMSAPTPISQHATTDTKPHVAQPLQPSSSTVKSEPHTQPITRDADDEEKKLQELPFIIHPFIDLEKYNQLRQELETVRNGTHPKLIRFQKRQEEAHQARLAQIRSNLKWRKCLAEKVQSDSYTRLSEKHEEEDAIMKKLFLKRLTAFKQRIQKLQKIAPYYESSRLVGDNRDGIRARRQPSMSDEKLEAELQEIYEEACRPQPIELDNNSMSRRKTRSQNNRRSRNYVQDLSKYRFGINESDIRKDLKEMTRNICPQKQTPHVQSSGCGFLNNPDPLKKRNRRAKRTRKRNYSEMHSNGNGTSSSKRRYTRREKVVDTDDDTDSGIASNHSPMEAVHVEVNEEEKWIKIDSDVFATGDEIHIVSTANVTDPWSGTITQIVSSQVNIKQSNREKTPKRIWVKNLRQGKFRVRHLSR